MVWASPGGYLPALWLAILGLPLGEAGSCRETDRILKRVFVFDLLTTKDTLPAWSTCLFEAGIFDDHPPLAGLRLAQVIVRLCEERSDVAICFWLVYRDRFAKTDRDDGRRQIVILNEVKNLVFYHVCLFY